ncbi:MAG: T9SS type A sorting domain-containing protein [Saprospiraceae bacterium]|nr:T9SS type A sorting domain-containing protein [Saprospiraceae bacterium]
MKTTHLCCHWRPFSHFNFLAYCFASIKRLCVASVLLAATFQGEAQAPVQPTMGELVGINSRISDPIVWQKKFGFIREYHEWANDINYDNNTTANCPTTGKYRWNPSYDEGNAQSTFNVYYSGLAFKVAPATKGLAPEMRGYNFYPSGCPKLLEQKPICTNINYTWGQGCPPGGSNASLPDFNWLTDPALQNHSNPALYLDHAKWNTLLAAKYGVGYGGYLLNYPPSQMNEGFSAYPRLRYIENGNEPEKSWFDVEHGLQSEVAGLTGKTYWQMTAPQFAAQLSADFDGHGRSSTLEIPGLAGRYFGIVNSVSQTKLVMAGLADLRVGYVSGIKAWCQANRVPGVMGFQAGPLYPFDVLNFHHYSTSNNRSTNEIFAASDIALNPLAGSTHGICPECDDLRGDLTTMLVEINNLDAALGDKEVWLSEFGYDAHYGTGPTSSPVKVNIDNAVQRHLRQSQWLVRSFLEISAAKGAGHYIHKAMAFDLRDNASKGYDGGLFDHCGLLSSEFQPKRAWYYVQTLRNVLKDYKFKQDLLALNFPEGKGAKNNCGISDPYLRVYHFERKDDPTKKIFALWRWGTSATDILPDITCTVGIHQNVFGTTALATRIEIVNFDENGRKYGQTVTPNGAYMDLPFTNKLGETPMFIIPGVFQEDPITPLVNQVNAVSVCCGAVRLTWTKPNPFQDPRVVSHLIYYTSDPAIVANPDLFEMNQATLFTQTWTTNVIIPGLVSGATYRFFVIPIDNYGNIPDLTAPGVLAQISTTHTVSDCSVPDNVCQNPQETCILKLNDGTNGDCFSTGYGVNEMYTCPNTQQFNLYDRAKETFGLLDQTAGNCDPLNSSYAVGCPGNGWTGYNYQNPAANFVEINIGGEGTGAKYVKVNTIYFYDVQGVGDIVVEYKNCACPTWQYYTKIKTSKYDQWVAIHNLPTFPVNALRFVKTSDQANVARIYLCTEPVICTPPLHGYTPGYFTGLSVKERESRGAGLSWDALIYNQTNPQSDVMDGYTLRYSTQLDVRGELVNPVELEVEASLNEKTVEYQMAGLLPSTTYHVEVIGARLPPYRPCPYPILTNEAYIFPIQKTSFTTLDEGSIIRDAGVEVSRLSEFRLEIYPNPGDGLLGIRLPDIGFDKVLITDAQGQAVKVIKVSPVSQNADINITQLPAGLYLLTATGPDGRHISANYVKVN